MFRSINVARTACPLMKRSAMGSMRGSVAFKYSDLVIDHYENPRNVGTLNKDSNQVGTGLVGAPACGDVMRLQIEVDDAGVITDSKFKTFGCSSAIASSSLATEWIIGKHVDDINITNKEIASHLKLPPVKLHCSMLAEDAIRAAVWDYKHKKGETKASKEEATA